MAKRSKDSNKKVILSTVLIFVAWQILDFVIHGKILMGQYSATKKLWRPMAEMNQPLMMAVTAITALFFVLIYHHGFKGQGRNKGLLFGLFFGLAVGVSMGFGTYSYQPITMTIAAGWTLGTIIQALAAAWITTLVYKEKKR